jgi:hypothetical protein
MSRKEKRGKRGQVWIETVIYILIGLSVIGLVLSYAKPRIESSIDRTTIERSIEMLSEIDSTFEDVKYVSGNSRSLALQIKRGTIEINPSDEEISFSIEGSKYVYSEIGQEVPLSGTRIKVLTSNVGGRTDVKLWLDYSGEGMNLTYNKEKNSYEIKQSPTPQRLIIKNNGEVSHPYDNSTNIDFSS